MYKTALWWAAVNGHADVCSILISLGADPDLTRDEDGTSPLYAAAQNNHYNVVNVLLYAGAHCDKPARDGTTPLWVACMTGNRAIAQTLIDSGADVNMALNKLHTTPLYVAAYNNNSAITKLLLAEAADVNIANSNNCTPLYTACKNGYRSIVEQLLHCADIDVNKARQSDSNIHVECRFKSGATPFIISCENGHLGIIKLLVEFGADIQQTDKRGNTGLHYAVEKGHYELVQYILATELSNSESYLTPTNMLSETPGQTSKSLALVKNYNGQTPIDLAFLDNLNKKIVYMLLRHQTTLHGNTRTNYSFHEFETKFSLQSKVTSPSMYIRPMEHLQNMLKDLESNNMDEAMIEKKIEMVMEVEKTPTQSQTDEEKTDIEKTMETQRRLFMDKTKKTKSKTNTMRENWNQQDCIVADENHVHTDLEIRESIHKCHLVNKEGIYYINEPDITLSNPNTMDCGLTSITITSQPVTEKEYVSPDGTNIISEMITLEPHGMVFEKHLLLKFPISQDRYRSDQDVCLMHCDGSCGDDEEMQWVNISQHSTPAIHKDEMFWFIKQGFCYLFTNHFSHIFLLQTPNRVLAQYGIFLLVSVYGKYVKGKLIITVGFHCHRCFANLLEPKGSFGTLLGYKLHCVYELQGPVTIHTGIDNNNDWEGFKPEQKIHVDQLLPLCNNDSIYNNTVLFRAKREVNVDREFEMDVEVLQDKHKSNIFVIACLKDISDQVEAVTADVGVMTDFQEITLDKTKISTTEFKEPISETTVSRAVNVKTMLDVHLSQSQNTVESSHTDQQALDNNVIEAQAVRKSDMGYLHLPITTTADVYTEARCLDTSQLNSHESSEQSLINLFETQENQEPCQHNESQMLQANEAAMVHIPKSFSQISNMHPYSLQQFQGAAGMNPFNAFNQNIGAAGNIQFSPFYQNTIQYINYNQSSNALDARLPEADCVFNRSVVSEQEKLCDIIDNDCKGQLAEIAKAVGDTNGTVDIKNITALSLLQVWKIHVKEEKCTWREFYDMLVKLKCQSAALQLKVVCDKDNLVRGLNKLKRDISIDSDLCGVLLELDVINLAENDEINLMKSPPEKISFLVLELLVKKPGNYMRVHGFFQALHSMRYYNEYIREFLLCPEDLDQGDAQS